MRRYNPKEIEPKWQKIWEDSKIYQAHEDPDKPKRYVLEYFPYPSGAAMHVGHVRNYTIGDAIARFWRQRGYNVLHPMGWDAFGLPAENYAIKNNISPKQAIAENTSKFKQQLMQMGFSYDWSREINSSDPSYYRWTQWFFKLLYERGLAYQKESLQWWCETDKTVLANEQVEAGKCWRCGNEVTKKSLKQWFFKITDYADRLAEDLEELDWSESIKAMQRNWIGKSVGAEIDFAIDEPANFVFVHGFRSNPESAFLPWITDQLGSENVQVPAMNFEQNPDLNERTEFLLSQVKLDQNSVLVGHSVGSVVAMKALEKLETPIKRLVLVAGFAQKGFLDEKRPFEDTFNWEFDFSKIKSNAKEIIILRDKNDTIVPASRAEFLKEQLGGIIVDVEASENHFYGQKEQTVLAAARKTVRVYTTRPDTLFGATFMVMAPEHPLVQSITSSDQQQAVQDYVALSQRKTEIERQEADREKTGVFTGAYAINPVNSEKIPVWIADYVLYGYGTGAIMAVPAHDERDFAFAKRFGLQIRRVIANDAADDECTHDEGSLINSGEYNGLTSQDMREKIVADLARTGAGNEKTQYKIRDWLISRQRYWGAPIPIIHCDIDGPVVVPDEQLPVVLPEVESYAPTGEGSVLETASDWLSVSCPKCGGPAKRETDTMDGFACSSWYFLRFADPHNNEEAFSKEKAAFWLPVDDYIGGAEHAVMHLLYARMWTKVMYDAGLVEFKEPFKALRNQGMILAPDGRKMSKSWGNVIAPDDIIGQGYGADSVRIMELFIGPWDQAANWSVEGMGGCYRFLNRVWTLAQEFRASGENNENTDKEITVLTHKIIQKVTSDLENMQFNTAISSMMEFVNNLYKIKAERGFKAGQSWDFALKTLTQLLAPFAPHIAEELWHELGQEVSVHTSGWPVHDDKHLVADTITIVVQVNGKVRANIEVGTDATEDSIKGEALNNTQVQKYLGNKKPARVIYVPGRLVNIVV